MKRQLTSLIGLCCLAGLLAACGQFGALYLPTPPPPTQAVNR